LTLRLGKMILSLLLAIVIFITPFINSTEVNAINQDSFFDFKHETINDNPEVSFTATGIATEPSPVFSAGVSTDSFLSGGGWVNTDINLGNIPKTWSKSPYTNALGKTRNQANNRMDFSEDTIFGGNRLIRFNFDFRGNNKSYDLSTAHHVIGTSNTYPNDCGYSMSIFADLYGNRYAMCGIGQFTKFDGSTGQKLWSSSVLYIQVKIGVEIP
jgi:hypothetical protein